MLPLFKLSKAQTFLIILLALLVLLAFPFFKTHAQNQVTGGDYIHMQQREILSIAPSWYIGVFVIKVDGCQYIVNTSGNGVSMIHKENCENPWHKEKH